jgi:hypothetical protein
MNFFDGKEPNRCRSTFEDAQLVYNPKSPSWYCPTSCIWAEDRIQLPGKQSLATVYKNHRSFFCNVLGVKTPNLAMHIHALQQKAQENPEKRSIMREMLNICALNPTAELLKRLSDCKCLPIKRGSREIEWSDCSEEFAIIDRRDYGAIFDNKIKMLDFSLEEVHQLNNFLLALGLEHRYTSKIVKEETNVEGGTIKQRLTDDLRKKAYAISRYVIVYASP